VALILKSLATYALDGWHCILLAIVFAFFWPDDTALCRAPMIAIALLLLVIVLQAASATH